MVNFIRGNQYPASCIISRNVLWQCIAVIVVEDISYIVLYVYNFFWRTWQICRPIWKASMKKKDHSPLFSASTGKVCFSQHRCSLSLKGRCWQGHRFSKLLMDATSWRMSWTLSFKTIANLLGIFCSITSTLRVGMSSLLPQWELSAAMCSRYVTHDFA